MATLRPYRPFSGLPIDGCLAPIPVIQPVNSTTESRRGLEVDAHGQRSNTARNDVVSTAGAAQVEAGFVGEV
jgi:hypothetical protein